MVQIIYSKKENTILFLIPNDYKKIVNDYCSNKDYKLAITKIEAQVHILTTVISEIEVENFKAKVKNYNAKRFGKYKGW